MIYSLLLYEYQAQNTLPSMTQVPPLAHIGSVALRRVNRNIVVSGAEEKKKKEKSAFSAALDARRCCEIGQCRVAGRRGAEDIQG